jgi:hypothetical protein
LGNGQKNFNLANIGTWSFQGESRPTSRRQCHFATRAFSPISNLCQLTQISEAKEIKINRRQWIAWQILEPRTDWITVDRKSSVFGIAIGAPLA